MSWRRFDAAKTWLRLWLRNFQPKRNRTPYRRFERPYLERLEDRITPTGPTITTLATFDVSNGSPPNSALVMDSSGNLYGTALEPNLGGGIFELPHGSSTIKTLALFPGNLFSGGDPVGNLFMDSSGNLYGTTTELGGVGGILYELPHGSSTIKTLASFSNAGIGNATSGVIMDSSGNLYGTSGSAVFELPNGSSTIITLAALGTGNLSDGGLTMDSSGKLYGTLFSSGGGSGGVFELPKGSSTITTLASGASSLGSVIMDSSGNLYGTSYVGGINNYGFVFELPADSSTIDRLALFNSTNGSEPLAGVIMDSSSNLFGTTEYGGTNNLGAVFELAQGSSTITALGSFGGTYGANPEANLIMDVSGNLYGTTKVGGTSDEGTIFEIQGAATGPHLAFVQQPSSTTAGASISSVTVAIEDNFGNIETNDSTDQISLALGSGSPNGKLNGTTTLTVSGGEATFNNLAIDQVGNGYSLAATLDNVASTTLDSNSFNISPAAANQLAFLQGPTNADLGATITPAVTVALEDKYGNIETSDNTDTISLALSPSGTLGGTTTQTVSNGVASFSDLTANQAGNNDQLTASTSAGGVGTQNSNSFTITPASVTTAASNSSSTYTNITSQTLLLSASVANASIPADKVNEGTVTFTVKDSKGNTVGSSVQGSVSGGKASASFTLPKAQAAGNYAIDVGYSDSAGNFVDGGDTAGTLTNDPSHADTTANNVSAVYSSNTQILALSANVADDLDPNETVGEGTVTFTVKNGSTTIGTAQSTVNSKDTASANLTLPAGVAHGSYTIDVGYSDSLGNFSDFQDTPATLTVTSANVATTANNVTAVYQVNAQTVTLGAIVADASIPTDTVDDGIVTFTLMNGTTPLGSAQGAVSGGKANVNFSLSAGQAVGSYSIVVGYSDSAGNFTDSGDTPGTLTILLAPIVTTNPSDDTVSAGGTVSFTAAANGSPSPTAQWQLSTDGGTAFSNISGATSTTLTLNNVQDYQNGDEYQAVFTNSVGTATTSAATLTVPYAPVVTVNPNDQTVTAGQAATFTAAVNGSPAPTVQWQLSSDGGKTFTPISGATSTTLTLNNIRPSQNGYEYQAVFTNSLGTTSTIAATLTVLYPPTVTINPSDQTVTAGQKATFAATVTGYPTPAVQWQVSTDGGKTFSDISGAISTTLSLVGTTTAMSGTEYRAVFTNSKGSVRTSAATLTVNPAVAPSIVSNPISQTVSEGASVSFTASANGSPTPAVQWQVSTDGGKTFLDLSGATSPTLTLTGVTAAMNSYEYQAVFSSSSGTATSRAVMLTVNASPSTSQGIALNVPPLLALLGQLMRGIETINANDTETVVYSLFGIALATANYDGSGNFVSGTLFGFSLPNWVWFV